MKRYEEYIEIKSPWIKSIPTSWDVKRLKSVTAYISRGETPVYIDDTSCTKVINQATFSRGYWNTKNVRFTSANAVGNESVPKRRDVLLASTGRGVLGKVFYFDQSDTYIADSHVTIIRTRKALNSRFLYYFLSVHYGTINGMLARGSTNQTELQEYPLKNMPVPVPPREEQDQIVRYLDWQVSKINRLIAAKRKQISLLREQIQQTIADAVYYGVDQTVRYQPVKMLYVEKIPTHWECKRGKYLFAEHDIRSMGGKEELLSVSHITGVTPRSQKNITMFKAESLVNYKICRKNDIAANTMWMWQGAIAVSSYHGVISPSYNTYHQIDNAYDPVYLDYMLRSKPLVDEYYVRSTGIRKSRLRLYPEQLLDMFFPVPPMDEQKLIAAVITEKTQVANDFIAVIEKQIEQINELRVRMISDVVTGQVDVRGIKVPEFEYVGEADVAGEQDEEETEEEVDG